MPHDQVIVKHAHGAAPQLAQRDQLEFHVHTNSRGKLLGQSVQSGAVAALVQQLRTAQANVKLQIVVRSIAGFGLKDATLPAAIPSAKQDRFEALSGYQREHFCAHLLASTRQVLFQFVAAINREAR